MFYSKLLLNSLDKNVERDVMDNYEMHRTLERVFEKKDGRILWRFEKNENNYILYCQSQTMPQWNKIIDEYHYYLLKEPQVVEYVPPKTGTWKFRILANAAKNTPDGRKGLSTIEEQQEWFQYMAEKNGFDIKSLRLNSYIKKFKNNSITACASKMEGILEIKDGEKFSEFVKHGIGKCKAFGFGLISLAKVA